MHAASEPRPCAGNSRIVHTNLYLSTYVLVYDGYISKFWLVDLFKAGIIIITPSRRIHIYISALRTAVIVIVRPVYPPYDRIARCHVLIATIIVGSLGVSVDQAIDMTTTSVVVSDENELFHWSTGRCCCIAPGAIGTALSKYCRGSTLHCAIQLPRAGIRVHPAPSAVGGKTSPFVQRLIGRGTAVTRISEPIVAVSLDYTVTVYTVSCGPIDTAGCKRLGIRCTRIIEGTLTGNICFHTSGVIKNDQHLGPGSDA